MSGKDYLVGFSKEDNIEAMVYIDNKLVDYYDPVLAIWQVDDNIFIDNGYHDYCLDKKLISKILIRPRETAADLYGWGSLTGCESEIYSRENE